VELDLGALSIQPDQPYLLHDLLGGDRYIWQGPRNYVDLDPHVLPAHLFAVKRRARREQDFDYFM
jgi:starch synthase (maltosyl-transferring)